MPLVIKQKLTARQRTTVRERGEKPRNAAQKRSWEIAARNETKFSSAVQALMAVIFTPEMEAGVTSQLDNPKASMDAILAAIPFFDVENPDTYAIWSEFARLLGSSYSDIIDESAQEEAKQHGWKIQLQKVKSPLDAPVGESTSSFINNRSFTRAIEMSNDMRDTVTAILTDGRFSRGKKPRKVTDELVREIRRTIGLTPKQRERITARSAAMENAGMSARQIEIVEERTSKKLRAQRAATIARTETLDAQTQGQLAAWDTASLTGQLPDGAKKVWVSTLDAVTSDVCNELDGQRVGVGQLFTSSIVGRLDGPPAHPNCRSTIELSTP